MYGGVTSSSSASSDSSSSAPGSDPSAEMYQLLSYFDFFLLCVLAFAIHYAGLYIMAATVAESMATLTAPFMFVRDLCAGLGETVRRPLLHRLFAARRDREAEVPLAHDHADDGNGDYAPI